MKNLLALLGLAALTTGCGKASEQEFNAKFDANFRSSCIASSMQGGVPNDVATKICDCSIAKINEHFSATDKVTMTEEQARPYMLECLNKTVQR